MKKILFALPLFFFSFISNAQKLEGKWAFEKMNFFGNIIYFDDSKADKEKLINAWIKMNEAENDKELKNEIIKNTDPIYEIAKQIFKSDIEFKGLELSYTTELTTGKLNYNSQGSDDKIKRKEVQIHLKYYENTGYSIMTFPMFGDFHLNEKLKVVLKTNKLVLEAIPDPSEDVMGAFIIYYGKGNEASKTNSDNVSIPNVKIGNQVWMQKNLDTDRFRNGDLIAEAKTAEEWKKASELGQPAWCNNQYNKPEVGKLYNWYAVNDPRGLAPKGWRIPTGPEVVTLANFLGGRDEASKKMKTTDKWIADKPGTNSNASGFSAMPAGTRSSDGKYWNFSITAYFWTSDRSSDEIRPALNFGLGSGPLGYYAFFFGEGCSVRCIENYKPRSSN